MNTQPSPQINFLEIVDNYVVYAIGPNVYQIEVTAQDLEEAFGVESRDWESPIGKHYGDQCAAISSLEDVHQSDYLQLIAGLSYKAEDITDSYESPIERYKAQQAQLAQIEEKETLLRQQLKELEELRYQIVCQEISKSDLIAFALDKRGIKDYYFIEERRGFSPSDEIKRTLKINGVTTAVTLDLESGILLFDGQPVSDKTLSFIR